MTGRSTVALVGFHGTGKTTYLGAIWQIIQDPRDPTTTEVEVRGDRSHLQLIGEQVARAERLKRTDVESDDGFGVTMRFGDGDVVDLEIPDLSGEGLRLLVEDRVWHSQLSDAVESADAVILFVSPKPFKLPVRSSFTDAVLDDFLAVTSEAQEDGGAEGEDGAPSPAEHVDGSVGGATEVEFLPRLACTAARVIDALENVLALRGESLPLRVAVVVSAWDAVDPGMTPEQWVGQRLPALAEFIGVNSRRLTAEVFGVSAQGGRLPEQKDELLAKGTVLDRAFARDGSGDEIALSEPLRWAIGG